MEFLSGAALVAAGVVLLVEQILKLRIIPLAFANKYPVFTNIVLSIVATVFLVPVTWSFDNIGHLAVQIGTVAVTAAIAYNQLIGKSPELKSLEGTGTK
jgi:uncharacterized membrane protein